MTPLAQIEFEKVGGGTGTLGEHAGEVLLVVNVASKCGLTPQYEGLQRLHAEKQDQGFSVIGFPANDFAAQEPGTDDEIAEFCSTQYSVTFPVHSKIAVVGEGQHPLYAALAQAAPQAEGKAEFRENLRKHGLTPTEDPDVLWNFEKFLVGRDGQVARRFAPSVQPGDPALVAAVEAELAKSAEGR